MNPQFLDVDFTEAAPLADRLTGALPRSSAPGDGKFKVFADEIETIPRANWKDLIAAHKPLSPLVRQIKDQNGEGSCAANSAAQCFEVAWNFQIGESRWIETSAMSLYKRTGSGPNSGSNIDSNLYEIQKDGILPVDNDENSKRFNHTHPAIGWRNSLPSGWQETAKDFVVIEWLDITTYDEFITALLLNFPVCYGRSGHSIAGIDPVWSDGKALVKYANSWHESWGEDGFGYDSERAVGGWLRTYGAWAVRTVYIPTWALD